MKRAILCFALSAALMSRAAHALDLVDEARQSFQPLPQDMSSADSPVTPQRVALGQRLFFDPRLSVDGTTSCSRCHQSALYGTDGLDRSHGNHDKLNARNAPSVFNAALQFVEHWIGDRSSVEDQAAKALTGATSFGNPDPASAIARISAIPGYRDLFQKAFPDDSDPITIANFGKAVGAFERTLVTPSRFDEFLKGDALALTEMETKGLRRFLDTGCATCHNGPGLGGGMYQKFGTVADYWTETKSTQIDKGRFAATADPDDLYVFKVPMLRNVAMTAPYFHDGSVATLPQAVSIMAKVQLGQDLDDDEVQEIVSFLESLTGSVPVNFGLAPVLPPSGVEAGN